MKEPVRAKKIGREFKEFMVRGNAIMLAVGVVIGGAFQGIVNSLVNDIIMPLIGVLTAGADFSELAFRVTPRGGAEDAYVAITYGTLITAIINFLIVGFVIFLLVKFVTSADGAVKIACRRATDHEEVPILRERDSPCRHALCALHVAATGRGRS